MDKKFEFYEFSSQEFKKYLEKVLSPWNGTLKPMKAILKTLEGAPLACRGVVIESGYVDKDYLDEFSAFYSKTFKDYSNRTLRIHFFSCLVDHESLLKRTVDSDNYLGFVVIRPTDLHKVGRALIKPPVDKANVEFVHCVSTFEAHIYGNSYQVSAMPFIQQDTQVGACAQASLWMLSRLLSKRFEQKEFLPSQITELATSHFSTGRTLPAERGLNQFQIADALKGMGLSAIVYSRDALENCGKHIEDVYPIRDEIKDACLLVQQSAKLADIAYRYIESGLPVIFGTRNHAVVGIGHTYDSGKSVKLAIERIPDFFVHDDNKGPYLKMPIFSSPTDGRAGFFEVECVIAVLPAEVSLTGEEAELMAVSSINELLKQDLPKNGESFQIRALIEEQRPEFGKWLDHLEYRTFLQTSVEYQDSLFKDMQAKKLDAQVAEILLRLDYPKYVWITEISSHELLNQQNKHDRKCLGRIVCDSTAPSQTTGVLSCHFADILAITCRQTNQFSVRSYPNSTPFGHKILA